MNILIKEARVVDPSSSYHNQVIDILITERRISKLGQNIKAGEKTQVVQHEGLHVSQGWVDTHSYFRDPGFESKEEIRTGLAAAAAGGFTDVFSMPATNPATDNKGAVEYQKVKAQASAVSLHPVGAVTVNRDGNDMAELYDMHVAGAVAFSDAKRPVAKSGVLGRALQYASLFNGVVIHFPYDKSFAPDGKMNEGSISTRLGLKGIPAVSEELTLARDIQVLEYSGGRLHVHGVSTLGSVEMIRNAKARGLNISCEVAAHQLLLTENELTGFDSNYKVLPPLRTEADLEALLAGIADGTVDVICSDHSPENDEEKTREFDHAAFGIIGLETSFAVANTALRSRFSIEQIISCYTRARKIFNISEYPVAEGNEARLTLFLPDKQWTVEPKHIASRSRNTPFLGKALTGKPLAIIAKGMLQMNS